MPPLIVNGVTIPEVSGNIKIGSTNVQKVICNNTTVWQVPTRVWKNFVCTTRTNAYYQTDDNARRISTTAGSFQFGSATGAAAHILFDVVPDLTNCVYVPGTALLKMFIEVHGDTTPGGASYLCAGQPFSQSGLTTIYRASSSNRADYKFLDNPDGSIQTISIPDQIMNWLISSSNKTLGFAVNYHTCWGNVTKSEDGKIYFGGYFDVYT